MKKIFLIYLIIYISAFFIYSNEFGNKIILLYQSDEGQTSKENLANWHLTPILSKLGFELEFLDINKNLPDPENLNDYYAVIGWLTSNSSSNPIKIVEWYENILKKDIKLVLMGAIGCWQDKTTKNYLEDSIINKIFSNFGVIYKGNWTKSKSILQTDYIDKEIYPKGFELSEDIDYFNFLQLNDNINKHLVISRKDMKNSSSPVVFTSSKGGYAFTNQYILKGTNFIIDLEKFIYSALFSADNEQRILVTGLNKDITDKIVKNFKLGKVNIREINFSNFSKFSLNRMKMYDLIILSKIDFKKVNKDFITKLEQYSASGGGLSIAGGEWNKEIFSFLGIKEYVSEKVVISSNIYFKSKIMPFSDKLKFIFDNPDETSIHYRLDNDIQPLVYGKAKDNLSENIPMAWEKKNKNGRIIVWLKELYSLNAYNTIFMQSALNAMNGHAEFFAGIAVIFLDDFPIPSYNIVRNIYPIPSKENLDDTDFYLNYALPDVLNILKTNNIPLSSYAIFSYDKDVTPPFKNGEYYLGKDNAFKKMIDKLIENGCEIGLHGYNHQSLSTKSEVTVKWANRQNMEDSLNVAKANFNNLIAPDYSPFSYVAPMNVIDDEGIKALIDIFPTLKVISTLFKKEESSYETEMDFGLLEGTDILKLPRTTSGYFFNDEFFFDFNNGLWSYGAWTHFIHLDDSYDKNRNKGILWQNLIKEFEFQLDYVKKNYPFLRFYTARDAYYILLDYEMSDYKFYHDKNKKEISIKISSIGSKNEKYIFIRLPENSTLKKIENGKLVYIFPEKDFIIIKTVDYITRIIYD